MEEIAAALGDSARWRIVELLAQRPRSVGELATHTGLRQPQTTKHLQTLAKAGLVSVFPLGQRRVYAVEPGPLRELDNRLRALLATIEEHADERDVVERYLAAIEAETAAAQHDRWADGRSFTFERTFVVAPEVLWRHWVDQDLLAKWWVPPSMTVTDCRIEPFPGGRVVLDYRDDDGGRYRSAGRVVEADEHHRLTFDLSVLDAAGEVSFTGHYTLTFEHDGSGTRFRLDLVVAETTVAAASFIAGIETGWSQVLDNLDRKARS
ncbi:metalloregulator ArsR/SmtB family transcription factor [Nocardia sp. NPDC050378]|uniref:metalloregulator ArsR/SmtB family transcription factor n=1 Tax=Nocardia sp. NPDC050378 TaxID=3155400 RepID=UPI0033F13757